MIVTSEQVKTLREMTGAGFLDCKKTLEEMDGDINKAAELLRKKGLTQAIKKMSRLTKAGIIEAYIHHDRQVGVMLELSCETDFVARTPEFRDLAKDIALQITAMTPVYISRGDVPTEVIEKELAIYKAQAETEGRPPDVLEKIAHGKVENFYKNSCLLEQVFIKDNNKKIEDLIKEVIARTGENIIIKRFIRFKANEN